MKNEPVRILLSAIAAFAVLSAATVAARADSIKISDVVQVVSSNPQRGGKNNSTQLRIEPNQTRNPIAQPTPPNDGSTAKPPEPPRVQSQEVIEITEEPCDCPDLPTAPPPAVTRGGGFPWWILGLGAVPLFFIKKSDDSEFSTPATTPTPQTPTPTNPIPEPVTLLLFGAGLAGLGALAARRRRRMEKESNEDDGQ